MVYMKKFKVKKTDGTCYIAEVYADSSTLGDATLTRKTKEILKQYIKENHLQLKVISLIPGYTFTHKPDKAVVLREPFDYEALQYFPKEYASKTYEIPVEWTGKGTIKVLGNSIKEAIQKANNQIETGCYDLTNHDTFQNIHVKEMPAPEDFVKVIDAKVCSYFNERTPRL